MKAMIDGAISVENGNIVLDGLVIDTIDESDLVIDDLGIDNIMTGEEKPFPAFPVEDKLVLQKDIKIDSMTLELFRDED